MKSTESSYQQGVMMEEDHRSVLITGGISVFLPTSQAEASIYVAGTVAERKLTKNIIKEERE